MAFGRGSSLPPNAAVGDRYILTTTGVLHTCLVANTWFVTGTDTYVQCLSGLLGNCDNTSDANKPISTAQQTALDLKASLTSPTFTGTVTLPASTSLVVTGAITSSGTAGIGYASGAGGTVTQLTSKGTGVTLSKLCGTITTHNAALAAAAIVTFTVTNTLVAATDVVHVQHDSGGTVGAYTVTPNTMAAGSFKITLRNNSAGSLSDALVLRFAVLKAVVA